MKQVNIGFRNRQCTRHAYSQKDHGAYAVSHSPEALQNWIVKLSPSHSLPDPNRQCRDWTENEILRLFLSLSLIKFLYSPVWKWLSQNRRRLRDETRLVCCDLRIWYDMIWYDMMFLLFLWSPNSPLCLCIVYVTIQKRSAINLASRRFQPGGVSRRTVCRAWTGPTVRIWQRVRFC